MRLFKYSAFMLLLAGCATPSPLQPTTIATQYAPYGLTTYQYKGNEYIIVRQGEGVAICPCLPPKAEAAP